MGTNIEEVQSRLEALARIANEACQLRERALTFREAWQAEFGEDKIAAGDVAAKLQCSEDTASVFLNLVTAVKDL